MKEYLQKCKLIFEKQLEDTLQKYKSEIQPIYDALCYAVSTGGKRIRPALCYLGVRQRHGGGNRNGTFLFLGA